MTEEKIRNLIWRILLDAESPRGAAFKIEQELTRAGVLRYSLGPENITGWGTGAHAARVVVRLPGEAKDTEIFVRCAFTM